MPFNKSIDADKLLNLICLTEACAKNCIRTQQNIRPCSQKNIEPSKFAKIYYNLGIYKQKNTAFCYQHIIELSKTPKRCPKAPLRT